LIFGQLGLRGVALRSSLHSSQTSLNHVLGQTSQRLLHLRSLNKQIFIHQSIFSKERKKKLKNPLLLLSAADLEEITCVHRTHGKLYRKFSLQSKIKTTREAKKEEEGKKKKKNKKNKKN
jgi:hypothetical protein